MFIFTTVLTLTTGSVFIMWLGEQITSRGIGNGMSLLIFAGIVVGLLRARKSLWDKVFVNHDWNFAGAGAARWLHAGDCRLHRFCGAGRAAHSHPVREARRGAEVMGGVSTHLPLKVNSGGVMADYLCGFDSDVSTDPRFVSDQGVVDQQGALAWFMAAFAWGEPLYTLTYVL